MKKGFFPKCSGCIHNGTCDSFIVAGKIEKTRIVVCKGLIKTASKSPRGSAEVTPQPRI